MTYQEAIDTLLNGNISDFKRWLTRCSKAQMLDAIEYYSSQNGNRHIIINQMRNYLEQ